MAIQVINHHEEDNISLKDELKILAQALAIIVVILATFYYFSDSESLEKYPISRVEFNTTFSWGSYECEPVIITVVKFTSSAFLYIPPLLLVSNQTGYIRSDVPIPAEFTSSDHFVNPIAVSLSESTSLDYAFVIITKPGYIYITSSGFKEFPESTSIRTGGIGLKFIH